MDLTAEQERYWQQYLQTLAWDDPHRRARVIVGQAGGPELADELLALYLAGTKTAGSGLVEDYCAEGEPLPAVGDHWIVLDGNGAPRCILRTERVETHSFVEVPERIAVAEGEGDLSVDFWRRAHSRFYAPFLAQWGLGTIEEATVITEHFVLVHPA